MTPQEFIMLVALVARKSAQWSHELQIFPADDRRITAATRERFCAEIRAVLDQIEAAP